MQSPPRFAVCPDEEWYTKFPQTLFGTLLGSLASYFSSTLCRGVRFGSQNFFKMLQMKSIYPNKNEYILLLILISLWLWCNHCRITCIVWEKGQCKKVDLSVVEIGGHIEREVSRIDYDSGELLYSGVIFTLLIAAFPFLFRLYYNEKLRQCLSHIVLERTIADWNSTSESMTVLFGNNWQVRFSIIGCN